MTSPRLRARALRIGSRIASVTGNQPAHGPSAADLGEPFGKDGDWVRTRTGIQRMRRHGDGESPTDTAAGAARDALAQAGVTAGEVDLVLLATCSVDHGPRSSVGDRIAAGIGVTAPAIVLNVACAGFCYAVQTADCLIRAGDANTVLIVALEHMSSLLDPADLGTSIIFGDGAGAAVVTAHDERSIGPAVFGSDGARSDLIAIDDGGRLRMNGREVFRWAVETVPRIALDACAAAGIAVQDVDVFVPHQANLRITDAVVTRLGLRPDTTIATDVAESGNTSAASVPLALSKLLAGNRSLSGSLALAVGFGAGLAYAAQVFVLP